MAFYVVCLASDHPDATELGPPFAPTSEPYPDLLARAGFTDIEEIDVTDAFVVTTEAWLQATVEMERDLRPVWGDAEYDEIVERRRQQLGARERQLHRRSLFVARDG